VVLSAFLSASARKPVLRLGITSTLFAVLEVATGQVKVGHYPLRRRREFLDFMNDVIAGHAGRQIHVILDNRNTHKPKRNRWLAQYPNVPTSACTSFRCTHRG
jgi:hypothetical protein